MKLTLASLADVVRQELGRDPSRSSVEALVNEAGEAWANAHNWVYLRDRSQDILTEAGVDAYKLGLGVRSVTKVHRPDSAFRPIPLVDFDYFESERSRFFSAPRYQNEPIATLQWSQEPDDDRPRLYLRLFTGTIAERLRVTYHAGWLPLDGSGDVADVPPPLTQPFVQWLRLYAHSREKPELYPLGSLEAYKASPAMLEARRIDGQIHNGVVPALTGSALTYRKKRLRGDGFYTREDYLNATGDGFAG